METEKDRGALLLVAVGIIVESRNVLAQENRHVTLLKKIKLLSFFVFHISLVFLNRSKLDVFHAFQKLYQC